MCNRTSHCLLVAGQQCGSALPGAAIQVPHCSAPGSAATSSKNTAALLITRLWHLIWSTRGQSPMHSRKSGLFTPFHALSVLPFRCWYLSQCYWVGTDFPLTLRYIPSLLCSCYWVHRNHRNSKDYSPEPGEICQFNTQTSPYQSHLKTKCVCAALGPIFMTFYSLTSFPSTMSSMGNHT